MDIDLLEGFSDQFYPGKGQRCKELLIMDFYQVCTADVLRQLRQLVTSKTSLNCGEIR